MITPFLMFMGQAEEAMNYYLSVFETDSEILNIERYGPEGPGTAGSVMHATFKLRGQLFNCIDSNVEHAFGFTPAISFAVTCESEADLDRLFSQLTDGGQVLMPLGAYPFATKYAWVADKFDVSWQLTLP